MLDFQRKFFLGVGAGVLLLLVAGLLLGFYSLSTMREVVSDQFNKQQLVLSEQAARQIETDFKNVFQELIVLNQSPTVQYLDAFSWANRIRVTLEVIRDLGVVEIGRVSRDGRRMFSVDREHRGRTRESVPAPWLEAVRRAADPARRGTVIITRNLTVPGVPANHQVVGLILPTYLEATNRAHPAASRQYAGLLYGLVDLKELVARVVKNIRSGRTGYAWVIDQEGTFLYHPLAEFIGRNAFTVREQKGALVSFDQINRLQKEKMLQGEQGSSWYFSGWHGGERGKIKKLIAYSPIRLELPGDALKGSVAVAAPVGEVDEAIHAVYVRQFLMQGVIIFAIILGGLVLLGFSWQYARSLKNEVAEKTRDWRESEERYRKLVENAQDLIFSVDRAGQILSLNRFGAQFLEGQYFQFNITGQRDVSASEKIPIDFHGRSIFNYFDPEVSFDLRTLGEIWDSGRPKALEHPVRIGSIDCWLSTQLIAIKDEQGKTQSILGVSRDISIRKKMETQMINTEKLASLGFLSASIAHEINSPIGIMLGYCDYLLELIPPEEDAHRLLQKIEQQGLRCKKIIDHLLGFSRYAEGESDLADVNRELENVLQVTGKVLMEKKILVDKKMENPIPAIRVNRIPLQQVFLNLINNAIAAMEGGGELVLETRWNVFRDRVEITIRDTGTGIRSEYREHIFEPFFTTKKAGEGTGLGLSVCDNIVKTYSGTIAMDSRTLGEDPSRHGTTFTITFPVYHAGSQKKSGK